MILYLISREYVILEIRGTKDGSTSISQENSVPCQKTYEIRTNKMHTFYSNILI